MDTQLLPQLDLPVDFIVGSDVTEHILKFYNQTCRLKATIFVLCMEGELTASVNLKEYTIRRNRPVPVRLSCRKHWRLSSLKMSQP